MIWLWVALASAQDLSGEAVEYALVRDGDTVAALAAELGHPAAEAEIRALNGLAEGAEPAVGAVLALPTFEGLRGQDAVLLTSTGGGTAILPGGATYSLAECLRVPAGSRVCTADDGFATVRLSPDKAGGLHDDISLLPSTCLEVQSSTVRSGRRSSRVYVSEGRVQVNSGDAGGGELVISTPSGLAAAEDGEFRVVVEDGAQRTEALTDPVSVMGAGAEVKLAALQGNRVNTGDAPGPAVDLPGVTHLELPGVDGVLYRPEFTWSPVDGAFFYVVELSTDGGFTELTRVEQLGGSPWKPESLLLGYRVPGVWWRVSSVDDLGFQGPPTEARQVSFPPGVGP